MVPLSPRQRQESRRGGEFTGKVHLGRKEWGTERAHRAVGPAAWGKEPCG